MAKATPEERAARMAARVSDAQETAAAGLAPGHIGQAVLHMLTRQDAISRADLVAHFDAIVAGGGAPRLSVREARAVLALLTAQSPPPDSRGPSRG